MSDRRQRPTVPTSGGRRYLTVAEIADRLGFSSKTVRKFIDAGTLRASKFPGGWRVAEDNFAEFERKAQFVPSPPSNAQPRT